MLNVFSQHAYIGLHIFLVLTENTYFVTSLLLCIRATAIIKILELIKANLTIAVEVHPEVTYRFWANSDHPPFSARPPKFRPRSTGGRKFEVGILA